MDAPSPLSPFDTPLALADVSGRLVDLSAGFAEWFPDARVGTDLGRLLPDGALRDGEDRLVERDVVTTRSGRTPVELRLRRRGDLWAVEGRDLAGERRRDDLLAFYGDVARRSNRALAAERDAAHALLGALGRPVFHVGPSGRPGPVATPECATFFGKDPGEIDVPAHLARDLAPGDAVALRAAYLGAFGQPLGVFEDLVLLLPRTTRPADRRLPALQLESRPVVDDRGRLTGIVHELLSARSDTAPELARLEAKLDALLADPAALLPSAAF